MTPTQALQKLNAELQLILKDPEVRNKLIAQGVDPEGGTPAEFGAFIQRESRMWAGLLKNAKIDVE